MMVLMVKMMMMMMDEVQLDVGDDGDDFPPPGRNFPGRFLPAGELFSLCGFPPRSGGGIPL